jgi:hypothetical protein
MARITAWKDDTLVVGDCTIDVEVLQTILNTDARLLWAFVAKDGKVQPVAYSEEQVIWLEPSDLSSPEMVDK